MSSNYPAGFTQSEHDRHFAVERPIQHAREEECHLCHRVVVFDTSRSLWFRESDYEIYGFRWLAYDAAVDAFNTQDGWVCSTVCHDDNVEEESEVIGTGKPFLVRRPA